MDSLTQIVLGAAVGEAVGGRKLGNRAMLWGAIGGTIPDLDVIGNLFLSEVDALAFHRGISHSIFFAVVFSFIIAAYTQWLYKSKTYQQPVFKWTVYMLLSLCMVYFVYIISSFALYAWSGLAGWIFTLGIAGITAYFLFVFYKYYIIARLEEVNVSYTLWYFVFFGSIFTHPILDCFTTYGTQLFAPFSDYRVSWNAISVVDPLYTIPLMICLITSAFYYRKSPKRKWWNTAGLVISSIYLLITVYRKDQVNTVIENTLDTLGIEYSRYMTTPTILNNVLWSATVECRDSFYTGLYSFFDNEKSFKLHSIPKNKHLGEPFIHSRDVKILKWFTHGYYAFIIRKDGHVQMNDLRYGIMDIDEPGEESYIFRFIVKEDPEKGIQVMIPRGGPPSDRRKNMLENMLTRIKGI